MMSNILKRLVLGSEWYRLIGWMKAQEKINREITFALEEISEAVSVVGARVAALEERTLADD